MPSQMRHPMVWLAISLAAGLSTVAAVPVAGYSASRHQSSPQAHQFVGNCQMKITTTRDSSTARFRAVGDGTCDGRLDGERVRRAPSQTEFGGTSDRLGPVLLGQRGTGVIRITDPETNATRSFAMSEQTTGTVGTITCREGGHGLVAIAPTTLPSTTSTYAAVVQFHAPCVSG